MVCARISITETETNMKTLEFKNTNNKPRLKIKNDEVVIISGPQIESITPFVMPDLKEVFYDQDNEIHYQITNGGKKTNLDFPNAEYDAIIDDIQSYLDKIHYGSDDASAKLRMFNNKNRDITDMRDEKNKADFEYQGNYFVSDTENIQGVRIAVLDMEDHEPIPTFVGDVDEGKWASANPAVFVPFTVGEFKLFAKYYYDHRERNFTNYKQLKTQLYIAYSSGATLNELKDFDIGVGWD